MSEEIRLDGLGLKPGVLERIVTLAALQVEGVSGVRGQGLVGRVQKSAASKGVEIAVGEDGNVAVKIHIGVTYGRPLQKIATAVQEITAEAICSQVGSAVASVDVFIDDVVFDA